MRLTTLWSLPLGLLGLSHSRSRTVSVSRMVAAPGTVPVSGLPGCKLQQACLQSDNTTLMGYSSQFPIISWIVGVIQAAPVARSGAGATPVPTSTISIALNAFMPAPALRLSPPATSGAEVR